MQGQQSMQWHASTGPNGDHNEMPSIWSKKFIYKQQMSTRGYKFKKLFEFTFGNL